MNIQTISLLLALLCTGCGSQLAITGKERTEYLRSIKPYGAHWIKEGMTRDERKQDSWACGAARTEVGAVHPVFPEGELRAAKLPTDPNDILAMSRLTKNWAGCMRAKGYTYIDSCDARCLYP